jgi:hypothetical protein
MVDEEDSYGKANKRIVFTDTDHRHAQLIIRLKHDGLRQSQFFRSLIGGYLDGDPRIQSFVLEKSPQSQKRKAKSTRIAKQGVSAMKDLGFNEGEIDNIFDLIEKEHPEL